MVFGVSIRTFFSNSNRIQNKIIGILLSECVRLLYEPSSYRRASADERIFSYPVTDVITETIGTAIHNYIYTAVHTYGFFSLNFVGRTTRELITERQRAVSF